MSIFIKMKNKLLLCAAFLGTFGLGFGFRFMVTPDANEQSSMKRVTGIGGIFLYARIRTG